MLSGLVQETLVHPEHSHSPDRLSEKKVELSDLAT